MFLLRHIPPKKSGLLCAGCGVTFCLLAPVPAAIAGEWTISPRVELEQSFTDNARSVAEGQQADIITTTTAGISVDGAGRRLQLNFDYNLSRDQFWDNTDLSGYRQRLLGAGNVEAIEDHVFVDTRASITQQSLARNGGEAATDRNVGTNDQTTVVNYTVTPNFAHRYGNWADSDLRYSFNETRFLQTDVGDAGTQPAASRSHEIVALLRSGRRFARFNWELSTTRTYTNNSSNRDVTDLTGEYAWTRQLALLGHVGREKIDNSGINSDDSAEFFWLGGFRFRPGPRTTVRLEAGRRFGGLNFSGDATYLIGPRTTLRASYEEDVRTDRQALTDNLNNLVPGPDGGLVDPNTGQPGDPNNVELDFLDQTTRQQNFSISLNGTRGRNTFSLFSTARKRTQEPQDTVDTVVTIGGNLNRRIWPKLDGGIGGNLSVVTEAANGIEDYSLRTNAFLTYRIMENFTGSVRYDYLYRNSDDNTNDLQENVVSVNLRKSF